MKYSYFYTVDYFQLWLLKEMTCGYMLQKQITFRVWEMNKSYCYSDSMGHVKVIMRGKLIAVAYTLRTY